MITSPRHIIPFGRESPWAKGANVEAGTRGRSPRVAVLADDPWAICVAGAGCCQCDCTRNAYECASLRHIYAADNLSRGG